MAKRKQSRASVRKSAKRREEEARQQRNRRFMVGGVVALAVVAVVVLALLLLSSEPEEPTAEVDPGETAPAEAIVAGSTPSQESSPSETWEPRQIGVEEDGSADYGEPGPLAAIDPAERFGYYSQAPEMIIDPSKEYEAVIRTEKGDMRLRLFPEQAPMTVNNFVFLAREGFYDGTIFHRVIQDFMAQAGDPTGTGGGGPGYQFADETDNGLAFDRPGLLAMANRGPNTNGSQFFITYVPTPHLNGLHTIFGELIEGQEVLDSLTRVRPGSSSTPQGDVIERIAIIER